MCWCALSQVHSWAVLVLFLCCWLFILPQNYFSKKTAWKGKIQLLKRKRKAQIVRLKGFPYKLTSMTNCLCQYIMRTRMLHNDNWSDNISTQELFNHSRAGKLFLGVDSNFTGQNNSAALGFHGQECSRLSGAFLCVSVLFLLLQWWWRSKHPYWGIKCSNLVGGHPCYGFFF